MHTNVSADTTVARIIPSSGLLLVSGTYIRTLSGKSYQAAFSNNRRLQLLNPPRVPLSCASRRGEDL